MKTIKVIIDTDPGTDDAIALICALNSPDLDILGLTSVGGNASLTHTTRNALRILEFLERTDVPVYRGASRPLHGRFQYAYQYHGPAGLTARLPSPKTSVQNMSAVDYIIDTARSNAGELTLIALGPLTNIAKALAKEPMLRDWVREIVVMGGALEVAGNVTPHAEFNIYDDPHAANVVFSSGIPVKLIGLDVCRHAAVAIDDKDWFSGKSAGERLAARVIRNWFKMRGDSQAYELYDPLTIICSIQPDLFTYRQATVTVETEDAEQIGRTRANYGSGNVLVATDVKRCEAKTALRDLLVSK